ncbi:hypothetical protein CGCA056_v012212 [Colletotrichum aenigma]|uniref:uncharacterized protein n=1 Tax=Colletotrichum aenigma TaxID=1215731 RepID=UPI001872E8D5|nr:uncharacterized protein CGCA056_v012212 [Colletotrichum aenigma]KAF5513004.1 hypothetical protein CGCA056_v012212 [Colletotrichum aenigma]
MDGEVATAVLPGWKARPENRAQADAQLRKLLEPRERLKQRELLRQQTGTDANNQSDDFEIDQFDGSLTVLSEQLYNKDTHFILELIQNADDNAYGASTIPSFGMRLDKNDGDCTFQTGCNEVGFTVDQIDALCRIASSTKKNEKDVRTGYIGEKGIGFKAVFKVADVLYIKSGFYSFKLDKRNGMVGTLLPLTADFPASKYHEHDRSATRMTLLLKGIEQYDKISKELTKIKPEILLFLRRLRSISIYKGQETTVYLAMHNEHEEKLQGETKTIDCQKQGESFRNKKFLITRTMVNDMPNEEKRAVVQIIEKYQHIPDAGIKVIHHDYFERLKQTQQNSGAKVAAIATEPESGETETSAKTDPFHQWLTGQDLCQLATKPRLTFYHRDSNEDRLTREWKWLSKHAVMDLVLLMRDDWAHYAANRRTLITAAKKLLVPCRGGKVRELQETPIPSSSLLEACPHINFADIPEPNDEKWRFLSNFSVIVEAKDEARIRELEVLRRVTTHENTLETVHPIYEYLAKNRSMMLNSTVEYFESRRLVFHPDQGWVTPKDCVWKSPAVLKHTRALCEVYPECDGLFPGRLGIKDAGMREVIQELETFKHSGQPEDTEVLKSVILLLSEYLQQRKSSNAANDAGLLEKIRNLKIFPVISDTRSSDQPSVVKLRSLADDWYIADQSALRSAFLGRVEILDFDVLKDIDKLFPLVKWLDIDRLLLSTAVKESSSTIGPAVLINNWSKSLQRRAKFASLLGNNTDGSTTENAPVYRLSQVSSIVVRRKLGQIHGLSEDGKILIEHTDGFIDVYVLRDPFDNQDRRVSRELSKLFIDQYQITKPEHVTQLRDILGAKLSEMGDLLEEVGIRCPWSEETPGETTTESRTVNVTTISPATSTTAKKALQPVNLMSQTTSACSSRPNGHTTIDRDRFKKVGVLGEAWMNEYFKTRIRNWDATRHWTSKLRVEKGYPDFLEDESKTADFTYTDENGRMLPAMGLPSHTQDWGDKHITYYIEVTGTVFDVSEPFHVSQHQMDMARKYSKRELIPTDIYVIARVYRLGHRYMNTEVKFYVDPWRSISAGRLNLKSEGYEVTPATK